MEKWIEGEDLIDDIEDDLNVVDSYTRSPRGLVVGGRVDLSMIDVLSNMQTSIWISDEIINKMIDSYGKTNIFSR